MMTVKELKVCCFGGIRDMRILLTGAFDVIRERPLGEISYALQTVLNCATARALPLRFCREDTRIEARILLAGEPYFVQARPAREGLSLQVENAKGEDCTAEYLYLTSLCAAQDAAVIFDGNDENHGRGLLACEWEEPCAAELHALTDGMCALEVFRAKLRDFVKSFVPERLHAEKPYELRLQKNGRYAVCHVQKKRRVLLSESEERVFRYLCFLHTAEFWHGFEKMRNLHALKKPILLQNFLERLDETVDARSLLRRARALGRQVILLTVPGEERAESAITGGENEEERAKGMQQLFGDSLQESYAQAARLYEIGDWSTPAPNLRISGADDEKRGLLYECVKRVVAQWGLRLVELDECEIDSRRVQSRALYREINEAPTPTVLLISNYGAAGGQAREFIAAVVKNRLYPVTNLWEQTVMEKLLFTVAFDANASYAQNAGEDEDAAFRVLDMDAKWGGAPSR